MGGNNYSTASHATRMHTNAAAGVSNFNYSDTQKASGTYKIHELLDPSKRNAAGKLIRESKDSEAHPESRAIAVGFDVTGSMGYVPTILMTKLPKLMAGIVQQGFCLHPHVLFALIGDVQSDHLPLQLGQFEAGNEADEALSNGILEGNGGGQQYESYDLFLFAMARLVEMDCWDKRGEKGMLFLIGDEMVRDKVRRQDVKKVFNMDIEADIEIADLMKELEEKWEIFFVYPKGGAYANSSHVIENLKGLFGERLILGEQKVGVNEDAICEVLIGLIATIEGFDIDAITVGLQNLGSTGGVMTAAKDAIVPYANTRQVSATAAVDGDLVVDGKDEVER